MQIESQFSIDTIEKEYPVVFNKIAQAFNKSNNKAKKDVDLSQVVLHWSYYIQFQSKPAEQAIQHKMKEHQKSNYQKKLETCH